MCDISKEDYELPMKLIEVISNHFKEKIITTIDIDYNICIHITNIDRISKRKYLSNLEGTGVTYRDACIDYINNLMNTKYNLRYKIKFYATEIIRSYVKKTSYKKIYNKKG